MTLFRRFLTLGIGLNDFLGPLASIIGIGSGVKNLVNSGNTSAYKPKGLGEADQTWQDTLGQLFGGVSGAGGQITPELAAAFSKMLGIDTSQLGPAGAAAGQQYGNLAGQAQGAGTDLYNQGQGLGRAGAQLWQTAQDPQNELRNKIQGQVTDASRAGTSARGIGMGGEAAGIENQDVSNFLMNWNQNQLARQAQGLQGYANASNQSGRDYAGALGAGESGAGYTLNSALAPFQMNQTAAGLPFDAANRYTGALGGLNSQYAGILQSIIPYLNNGQGAANSNFYQGQVGLNNFTTGLQNLGKTNWGSVFGSTPAGYGYGTNYGNDNTSVGPPNLTGGSNSGGGFFAPGQFDDFGYGH